MSISNPDLQYIFIHLAKECNYACSYCYVGPEEESLTFEEWGNILRQGHKIGVRHLGILGGEPLLYQHLEELLCLARRLDYAPIYLYTNGSLLDASWIQKFKKYQVLPVVKFESRADVYRDLTQQEKFPLEAIKEKIRACGLAGLGVLTFIVLNKKNVGDIATLIRESLELGAFPVLERFIPIKDCLFNADLEITDDEFVQASLEMDLVFRPVKFLYAWGMKIKNRKPCSCYDNLLSVTSSGDVLPCPYLAISESLGNLKKQSLVEIQQVYFIKKRSYCGASPSYVTKEKRKTGRCLTYSFYKTNSYGETRLEFCDHLNRVGYMLARFKLLRSLRKIFLKRLKRRLC